MSHLRFTGGENGSRKQATRFDKASASLAVRLGSTESRREKKVVIGRELTKMFEEVVRGSIQEGLQYFAEHPEKIKGEFVIIVYT